MTAAADLRAAAHKTLALAGFAASAAAALLLGPGAVDMGGLWAVPEFKDYDTLTAAQVQALYDELCLSRDELSPIIRRYNNPWDYA